MLDDLAMMSAEHEVKALRAGVRIVRGNLQKRRRKREEEKRARAQDPSQHNGQ